MNEALVRAGLFVFDGLTDRFHRNRPRWLEQRIATLKGRIMKNRARGWDRLADGQMRRVANLQAQLDALRGSE